MTSQKLLRPFVISLILIVSVASAFGQAQTQYDKGTPPQHTGGVSSFGSYSSTELGTVNLSNGSLNFKIPLGSVGGRGFTVPLTLNYSSKVWSGSMPRSYSSSFFYNPRDQITQEVFGTQTPLYHKLQYNIRGQLWDVRVSTGADINGSWNRGCLQYFYESTLTHGASGPDNNGNVLKANHYIPFDEQSNTWAIHDQLYTYDALNRITSVANHFVTNSLPYTQQSLQSYTYDRWGNRTINPAQTWGAGVNNKVFTVDTATNRLSVPGGQPGSMIYDFAGNLTTDTYSGAGARTYDADNRMTTAADNTGQTSRYAYDAEGNRVRVQVASGQEMWHVYGFDNELLAEYQANATAAAPEKEYGYRSGEMLVTATGRFNVALAANGAVATASSTATGSGFSTTGAINGNNRGPWGNGEGWNDNTPGVVPDWIQVDFAGSKTIDEISVFGLHDNYTQENTPTETQTFTLYGLQAFTVQYWNGSAWTTIPSGNVTGNNKVWRKFTFSPITTSKIRVTINTVPDSWSRVVEIQAFGTSAGGEKIQWLVPDSLGTPRIVLDQTGILANVKRHDYLPFGEELFAGTGGRTAAQGYTADGIRQQFTSKERDTETGLDYFLARYYTSVQGRFTSPDEFTGGPDELYNFAYDAADNPTFYADLTNPQSLNKYQYTYNNPVNMTDQDGHCPICAAVVEVAGTVVDVVVTVRTLRDPNASTAEKVATVVGTVAGVALPGGGYGAVTKAIVKSAKQAKNLPAPNQDATTQKGDYSNIKDPKNPREGADFTKRQKREARDQNKRDNGGQMKSDGDGKPINEPVRTDAGGKRDSREAQLDHKKSKANGGTNRSSNIRVISAEENQRKGKKNLE